MKASVLAIEALKTIVLKFKDLNESEKQEVLEYVKVREVKDSEKMKLLRIYIS
jgi:hypothetical protein